MQNNQKLIYNDVRKFGFIKIFELNNIKKYPHLKDLGPEPLQNNWNFLNILKNYIGRKRIIKNILMDQKFISGIGIFM